MGDEVQGLLLLAVFLHQGRTNNIFRCCEVRQQRFSGDRFCNEGRVCQVLLYLIECRLALVRSFELGTFPKGLKKRQTDLSRPGYEAVQGNKFANQLLDFLHTSRRGRLNYGLRLGGVGLYAPD